MKKIIRIEHNCGNGFWTAQNINGIPFYLTFSFYKELSSKHANLPTPQEEGINFSKNDYCAFTSIEQMLKWINPEWFNEIIEKGFKIWMIDVDKYKETKYQIIFKKKNILFTKDITELFIDK